MGTQDSVAIKVISELDNVKKNSPVWHKLSFNDVPLNIGCCFDVVWTHIWVLCFALNPCMQRVRPSRLTKCTAGGEPCTQLKKSSVGHCSDFLGCQTLQFFMFWHRLVASHFVTSIPPPFFIETIPPIALLCVLAVTTVGEQSVVCSSQCQQSKGNPRREIEA